MALSYKNTPEMKGRRRRLRREKTKAEFVLWQELRAKRIGYKFYRQFSFERKFIVDFYCEKFRLIIELDGPVHDDELQKEYDKRRQRWLEERGFFVVRFKNDEVLFERERVMEKIRSFLK